jgi:hypothetical protein
MGTRSTAQVYGSGQKLGISLETVYSPDKIARTRFFNLDEIIDPRTWLSRALSYDAEMTEW